MLQIVDVQNSFPISLWSFQFSVKYHGLFEVIYNSRNSVKCGTMILNAII